MMRPSRVQMTNGDLPALDASQRRRLLVTQASGAHAAPEEAGL